MRHPLLKSGFGLLEALIATLIIGILLSTLFGLYDLSFNSVLKLSSRFSRFLLLKQELQEARKAYSLHKPYADQGKKIEDPPTQIQFATKNIGDSSSLKKYEHAQRIEIQATWEYRGKKIEEKLIAFKQKSPPKEDEKTKKS